MRLDHCSLEPAPTRAKRLFDHYALVYLYEPGWRVRALYISRAPLFWGQQRKQRGFHIGGNHLHTIGGPEMRRGSRVFLSITLFLSF